MILNLSYRIQCYTDDDQKSRAAEIKLNLETGNKDLGQNAYE